MPDSLRNSVLTFAKAMENELLENAHKGSWVDLPIQYLLTRLDEEVAELRAEALCGNPCPVNTIKEAAGVANFAMMIADRICSDAFQEQQENKKC